jgi:hypothetical protein
MEMAWNYSRKWKSGMPRLRWVNESEIQAQITEYLTLHHIFHYRNAVGGGRKVRFGTIGAPDLVCVIKGQFVGIEVKDAKNEQSRGQVQFETQLKAAGGKYILARSLEDVIEGLR